MRNLVLGVEPIDASGSLRDLAYTSLKAAIAKIDIYGMSAEVRLDERKLAAQLGMSRTPVREALNVLEQEGFVRSEPRRGVFLIRKTKQELIGMIHAWAALESMAARLGCACASDDQIKQLRKHVPEGRGVPSKRRMDEYLDANILFHQSIIAMGNCKVIEDITSNLFLHIRGIRNIAIREDDRIVTSIKEHREILHAIEQRDATLAEYLVRSHAVGLATHVQNHQYDF